MYGYKRISLGKNADGKKVTKDEHRIIMENYLGRKLDRNEVVHHVNENKKDNRIENLEVMTLSNHSRKHRIGKKMSMETKNKLKEINLHKPKYSCRRKTKEDIINIVNKYKELRNYREVDRYFNFSNKTTRDIIVGEIYHDYQPMIKKMLNNEI